MKDCYCVTMAIYRKKNAPMLTFAAQRNVFNMGSNRTFAAIANTAARDKAVRTALITDDYEFRQMKAFNLYLTAEKSDRDIAASATSH